MKRRTALLTGSFCIGLTAGLSAQSGSPPGRDGLSNFLSTVIRLSLGNEAARAAARTKKYARPNVSIDSSAPTAHARAPAMIRANDTSRWVDSIQEAGQLPTADSLLFKGYSYSLYRKKMLQAKGSDWQSCCEKVVAAKRKVYYLSDRTFKMVFQVKGIYTRKELLFFQLAICNHSHLDYDVDSIRFFITDTRGSRNARPATLELAPLYFYGNGRTIPGKSREDAVAVLPRFTLPASGRLVIQVIEKNGGRHLQVEANNFAIVNARVI
ncbi:DUF4138 domain-containing protein [Flavitalea flava]